MFGSPQDPHIVDGVSIVLGKSIGRYGPIQCHVFLLGLRCAEIRRVIRSSLAVECRAAISDADRALRMQMLLTDLVTGKYDISLPHQLNTVWEIHPPHLQTARRYRISNNPGPRSVGDGEFMFASNRFNRHTTTGRKHVVLHVRNRGFALIVTGEGGKLAS